MGGPANGQAHSLRPFRELIEREVGMPADQISAAVRKQMAAVLNQNA